MIRLDSIHDHGCHSTTRPAVLNWLQSHRTGSHPEGRRKELAGPPNGDTRDGMEENIKALADAIYADKVRRARRLSMGERIDTAIELFEGGARDDARRDKSQ